MLTLWTNWLLLLHNDDNVVTGKSFKGRSSRRPGRWKGQDAPSHTGWIIYMLCLTTWWSEAGASNGRWIQWLDGTFTAVSIKSLTEKSKNVSKFFHLLLCLWCEAHWSKPTGVKGSMLTQLPSIQSISLRNRSCVWDRTAGGGCVPTWSRHGGHILDMLCGEDQTERWNLSASVSSRTMR